MWTNGSTFISITEGQALSITCYQSSNPPSSGPKWWKLNGMGKMDLFANDSGLYVILVTRRDSGIYICEALNRIGTGSTNITINVLCKFYLLYAFVIFIIDINSQTCIPNKTTLTTNLFTITLLNSSTCLYYRFAFFLQKTHRY